MKIIKPANNKSANAMNAEGYEFKLCGGSVEPKDKKKENSAQKKNA